jgi:uncharacterized protein
MTDPVAKTPACALCEKPMDPKYRPFCSKRCADVDLHRWLSGGYTIPGDVEEDDLSSPDDSER